MKDRGFSDLLSTASSVISSQSQASNTGNHASNTGSHASNTGNHARPASFGEVKGSAQFIMKAAKSKLHRGEGGSGEEIDKGKLAGAAKTLLGAASHHGKLDGTRLGKYTVKAEGYLSRYEAKHGRPNGAPAGTAAYSTPSQFPHPSSNSQGNTSGQVPYTSNAHPHHSQGYSSPHYSEYPHSSRPTGFHGHSEGYSEPYQSRPSGSQDYATGYPPANHPYGQPPAGYPASESRPKRNYY